MDDHTPREVWLEYEARKRVIDARLTLQIGELYRQRDVEVEAQAQALGCGVPEHVLTDGQRIERAHAMRRWGETVGCTG